MTHPLPLPGEVVDLEEIAARRRSEERGLFIGYARVSSPGDRQSLDLQLDALKTAGVDPRHIFIDRVTGTKNHRPGLAKCLEFLRPGDTLVFWKLDRLSRRLVFMLQTLEALTANGIAFKSITESVIDTSTPQGAMLTQIYGVLAQFSNEQHRERVQAGVDSAAARGRRGGRPRAFSDETFTLIKAYMIDNPNISQRDVARSFGVKRATLCNLLRREKRERLTDA